MNQFCCICYPELQSEETGPRPNKNVMVLAATADKAVNLSNHAQLNSGFKALRQLDQGGPVHLHKKEALFISQAKASILEILPTPRGTITPVEKQTIPQIEVTEPYQSIGPAPATPRLPGSRYSSSCAICDTFSSNSPCTSW